MPALDDEVATELELLPLELTALDLTELEEATLDLTELELTSIELEDLIELLAELATDDALSPTTP